MKRLLICLLPSLSLVAMENRSLLELRTAALKIKAESVHAMGGLKDIELYHNENGFSVVTGNEIHAVKNAYMDPVLRNITAAKLLALQKAGYISINKKENGDYTLLANGRIVGGGPAFGAFLYWLTKSACYGALIAPAAAGTAAVVAATGGGAIPAMAGAGALLTAKAGLALGTTVGIGSGVLATGIAATGSTVIAAEAVAATVVAAGGVAGVIAAIEAASIAAFAAGTACVFLP